MSMNFDFKKNIPDKDGNPWKPRLICPPGRTKQSFRDHVDVNHIVAKYRKTGFLEHVSKNPGVFADVSGVGDFQEARSRIRVAEEAFEQLPSALRKRFANDPGELVKFISDDVNRPEAILLGLIPKPKAVKEVPLVPPVVSEPVVKVEEPKATSE